MFGLGALLLSVAMGGISYFTTRHFLVAERESASLRQAYVNASLIRSSLHEGDMQVDQLLASLDSGSGSTSVLDVHGTAFASPLAATRQVPDDLLGAVSNGTPATQTFVVGGRPLIAVGVPIPSVHANYFEVFDVSDLDAHAARAGPGPDGRRHHHHRARHRRRAVGGGQVAASPHRGLARRRWPSPPVGSTPGCRPPPVTPTWPD